MLSAGVPVDFSGLSRRAIATAMAATRARTGLWRMLLLGFDSSSMDDELNDPRIETAEANVLVLQHCLSVMASRAPDSHDRWITTGLLKAAHRAYVHLRHGCSRAIRRIVRGAAATSLNYGSLRSTFCSRQRSGVASSMMCTPTLQLTPMQQKPSQRKNSSRR